MRRSRVVMLVAVFGGSLVGVLIGRDVVGGLVGGAMLGLVLGAPFWAYSLIREWWHDRQQQRISANQAVSPVTKQAGNDADSRSTAIVEPPQPPQPPTAPGAHRPTPLVLKMKDPLGKLLRVNEVVHLMPISSSCPNCGAGFGREVKRSATCPGCAARWVVKRMPFHRDTEGMITEADYAARRVYWDIAAEQAKASPECAAVLARHIQTIVSNHRPITRDLLWGYYNDISQLHMKRGEWGMHRCVRYDMALYLAEESRMRDAIAMLGEVLYLDVNGATNGDPREPETLFSRHLEPFAPRPLQELFNWAENAGIPESELEDLVLTRMRRVASKRHVATPEQAWTLAKARMAKIRATGSDAE